MSLDMVYFEIDGEKIAIGETSSPALNKIVKRVLKEKSYRGDLMVNEDDKIVAKVDLYGSIIVEKEMF